MQSFKEIFENFKYLNFVNPNIMWAIFLFIIVALIIYKFKIRPLPSLILRTISVLCLLAALSIPFKSSISIFSSPNKTVLIDISYSLSKKAIESCIQKADRLIPDSDYDIYPFSSELHAKISRSKLSSQKIETLSTQNMTNFENSLNSISKKISSTEIILCTDGHETKGQIDNIFSSLKDNSIKIHPLFPDIRTLHSDQINIKSLSGPLFKTYGEDFTFRASIENPLNKDILTNVEFSINNAKVKSEKIQLSKNSEIILDHTFEDTTVGLHKISVSILDSDNKNHQRSRWIQVKEKPRILLISSNKSESTLANNLLNTLGYDYESINLSSQRLPSDLDPYSGIIINNVNSKSLTKNFQDKLKEYTKNGSGLLILGGDKSYGLGGYAGNTIDEISPLKSVPPRPKVKRLPSAVALVIDKSGSMREYGRMTSSRLAALETIKNMKDEDYVSIIGFDHAPLVVMDLQKVSKAKPQAEMRLRNLTPGGGTNLLPALSRARFRLSRASAGKKHIIVLTDGILPNKSSSQFSMEINKIKQEGISVSTIALGHDADVPFMKFLASEGKGSFYQVTNPKLLPRIFLDDIKMAIGEETMQEQSEFAVNVGPAGMLSSNVRRFPHLLGFVETEAKSKSKVELITRKDNSIFPIFASWNYGAGKVFAFSSDLQGRWSSPWTRWRSIGPFWDDIFSKLRGSTESTNEDLNFDLRYKVIGKTINFELFIYEKNLVNINIAQANMLNKLDNKSSEFQFRQEERGRYVAQTTIDNPGDFVLSILFNELPLPPLGISVHPSELGELRGNGVNFEFLNKIANRTGGILNPSQNDMDKNEDVEVEQSKNFILPFILLGLIILLSEIFIRERKRFY